MSSRETYEKQSALKWTPANLNLFLKFTNGNSKPGLDWKLQSLELIWEVRWHKSIRGVNTASSFHTFVVGVLKNSFLVDTDALKGKSPPNFMFLGPVVEAGRWYVSQSIRALIFIDIDNTTFLHFSKGNILFGCVWMSEGLYRQIIYVFRNSLQSKRLCHFI